jgi:DNA-binding IclR family transcriptional regulator
VTPKPYGTVLLKAAKIMDYLSENPNSSLHNIALNTGLTNSTALKILETLVLIGYVSRDKSKNFRLGAKLIRYANHDIEQIDLVEVSLPYLEKLQKEIDETIHLGILDNYEILYLNKLEPVHQTIRMSSKVGITRPLYSSAMGKAVLAELSTEQKQQYFKKVPLVPFTEHTITNSIKLGAELKRVKELGVAFDDEEMENDIFCVGTALKKDDEIVGAFSISMPKYRKTDELEQHLIEAIKETKDKIEQAILQ